MFNSVFLDVVIGLAFLFCMVSLAATSVREMIEGMLKTRAVMLERGIRELLNEGADGATGEVTRALFDNPQIAGLFAGGYPKALVSYWTNWFGRWTSFSGPKRVPLFSNLPSYIPSRNFALAVLDHVVRGAVPPAPAAPAEPAAQTAADTAATAAIDIASIRAAIGNIENPTLKRILLTALDESADDLDRVRQSLETWFDNSMDRVSGWYRRQTQTILFLIGLLIAALLNINAITIGQRLLVDDSWRASVVAAAAALPSPATPAATDAKAADPKAADPKATDPKATNPKVTGPKTADSTAGSTKAPIVTPDIGNLEKKLNENGFMIGAPLRPGNPRSFVLFGFLPITICGWLIAFLAALPGYLIVAFATALGAPFWFDMLNRLMVVRSTVKPHEKSPEEGSKDNRQKAGGAK
jgi:hypothetical protein